MVLNGTYDYLYNFDEATKEICHECAAIQVLISANSLIILITKENWKYQWRGRRKSTLLSESGLHFGNYLAGMSSDHTFHFYELKASLIIKRGIVLECWACRLSVMLEKIFGCALVMKLQSILFMEADFNASNKIIYGHLMLDTVWKYELMPEEIFSKKNHLADDGTLAKVLFYDIIWQTRLSAGSQH